MQPAMQQKVIEYKSEAAMRRGMRQMNADGWQATTTTAKEQRSGCLRVLLLGGIGALIWKPKPHYLVTYSR